MIFPIPLAIIFGILTIISVFTTASFGIAVHKFNKKVFGFHMFFAFLTLTLAVIHLIFAFLLFFYGEAI
ncbi:MAG: hypothetical protein AABX54_02925 [Nanoarchaeota archaeon]